MAIKIIEEPDIHLTRAEHDRFHRMWVESSRYTTAPQAFEDFVRSQLSRPNFTRDALTSTGNPT